MSCRRRCYGCCCCWWRERKVVVVEELFLKQERDLCSIFVPGRRQLSLAPGLGNVNPFSLEVGQGCFRIVLHTEMRQCQVRRGSDCPGPTGIQGRRQGCLGVSIPIREPRSFRAVSISRNGALSAVCQPLSSIERTVIIPTVSTHPAHRRPIQSSHPTGARDPC